jgi:trimeric autotransporter adhesin
VLAITVSGSAVTNAGETVGLTTTAIERILIGNFETDASGATLQAAGEDSVLFDLSNVDSALTTIGTSTSTNVEADTYFTNVQKLVNVVMAGRGDMSVAFASSVVTGASDSLNLTVNGTGVSGTNATLKVAGIETINITSATASNFVTIDADNFKAVTVAGDKNISVTISDADVTTFDASTATGNVTADLSAITLANLTSVKGGSGSSDTFQTNQAISVTGSTTATNALNKVSGFETVKVAGAAVAVTLGTNDSGVTRWNFDDGAATNQQTLTLNAGYNQAVTVTLDNTDDVTDNAGVALTINVKSDDLLNTNVIAAGTGTADTSDVINVTANGGTSVIDNVSGVETINILAGTAGDEDVVMNVGAADNTVASGKNLVVNAAALTNTNARLEFTGTGETNGNFSITGGAGNDSLVGGNGNDTIIGGAHNDTIDGSAGNDVIDGGDGRDSITAGTGDDSISGGAENDTFILSGNLTSGDTIDGGDGNDTMTLTTVTSSALTNVKNVENLAISGASSLSLTANLGSFTSLDLSDATDQVVTFGSGYTAATSVTLEAGDSVTNSANIALSVTAETIAAVTTGTTITGGTGTDTLTLYADAAGATLTNISGVETITILANKTNATTATGTITTVSGNVLADKTLTINASALTDSSARFVFDGSAETDTLGSFSIVGGASNDAITGGGGNDSIDAGAHNDTITSGAGNDSLIGGAGNDTFVLAGNLTYQDTIGGGDGNDTLSITSAAAAIADVAFMSTTGVENIQLTGGGNTVTLGAYALAAGVTKVASDAGVANAIDSTTATSGFTFQTEDGNDTLTGGSGNDTFVFDNQNLDANDDIIGGLGTDTVRIDNDDADADTNGETTTSATVDFGSTAGIEQIVINDTATDNSAGDVSVTFAAGYAQTSVITVDGSALDAGETLSVDADNNIDDDATTTANEAERVSMIGGGGDDTLKGGAAADTASGGSGADVLWGMEASDVLTGGAGNDTFRYGTGDSNGTKLDTITDFEAGADKLRLDLAVTGTTEIDVNDYGDATSNSDGLSLLSGTSGAPKIGQYFFNTGNKSLVLDVDGNGLIQSGDLIINMTDETGFAESDMRVFATAAAADAAQTITTGDGDDVVFANDGIDTITTNAGNDFLQGSVAGDGSDADVMKGGAGNDTYSFVTASQADNLITEVSGTDTLLVGASISLALLEIGATNAGAAGTDLIGATAAASIEQIVLATGGVTATFAHTQITGNALLVAQAGDGTGTQIFNVLGGTGADTINLSSLTFTVTGATYIDSTGAAASMTAFTAGTDFVDVTGAGDADAITLASIASRVSMTGVAGAADRDTITGFTSGTDKMGLDVDYTTINTAAGAAAVVHAVANVAEVTDANYDLNTLANTDLIDIYILAGGNEAAADLAAATNGSELVKYLGTTGAVATAIVSKNATDKFYIAAYDAGNTYIYVANAGGSANVVAGEIALVATLTGTATVVAGDFYMVA